MNPDFDRDISRAGTGALKWDGRLAQFGRADVLPLWVADMDFAAPKAVTEALVRRAAHPVYGYTIYPEALYESLADWLWTRHAWRIEPDWVLWTPGVVPSLYAAVQAFSQAGEGVIVQPPVYPPFLSAVVDSDRRLCLNPLLREAEAYGMDFDGLEHCARDASLLLLCSPHNPVGRVWRPDELAVVLDIARRHGLTILSDEIHHDLVYPGHRHQALATLAENAPEIVTAVSPSKSFNIPGLGLSALIAPDPGRRAALARVFARAHVHAANPFSIAAFVAAYQNGGPWLDALVRYLETTRDAVLAHIAERLPGIRAIPPEGSYLLWLDCRELGLDDRALEALFVRRAGLGLNAGQRFGTGGSGHMRLNLAAPRARVMQALAQLADALDPG